MEENKRVGQIGWRKRKRNRVRKKMCVWERKRRGIERETILLLEIIEFIVELTPPRKYSGISCRHALLRNCGCIKGASGASRSALWRTTLLPAPPCHDAAIPTYPLPPYLLNHKNAFHFANMNNCFPIVWSVILEKTNSLADSMKSTPFWFLNKMNNWTSS